RARAERRPASPAATWPVPRGRRGPEQDSRPAVLGQRDRRQDYRAGEVVKWNRWVEELSTYPLRSIRLLSRVVCQRQRRFQLLPPKTLPATKKCAGARVAAITRYWRR